jgi:hypothetical protein
MQGSRLLVYRFLFKRFDEFKRDPIRFIVTEAEIFEELAGGLALFFWFTSEPVRAGLLND